MKNHWLELIRQRGYFFWTAEFTELNSFILNPRRAEIERLNGLDWKLSLQVSLQGRVSVIFKSDADSELTNFLNLAKMRMSNWKAKFCKYKNNLDDKEIEYVHLDGLNFNSIGFNLSSKKVRVTFDYNNVIYLRR